MPGPNEKIFIIALPGKSQDNGAGVSGAGLNYDREPLKALTEGSPKRMQAPADSPELLADAALPEEGQSAAADSRRSQSAEENECSSCAVQVETSPEGEGTDTDNCVREVHTLSNDQVMEQTALLWKYHPVPDDEPDPVPEYIHATVAFPGGRVIGARVRGKKHKHEGTHCDDWYEVANCQNVTFVVVSDGAGSKRFSRIGARESCKAATGYLVDAFEELFSGRPEIWSAVALPLSEPECMEACGVLAGLVQKAVIQAYEAVEAAFYSRKTDPAYENVLGRGLQFKDLSGTLLVTVIIPIDSGTKEHLIISCQVGDGMIAVLNSKGAFEGSVKLMGVPDSGDFSGETDFLTSASMKSVETLQHRTKISRAVVDTVMVMSDGVADDYFPNETEMRRLYFDLKVNGVLETPKAVPSFASLTQEQRKLFKRVPDPIAYPWVNDHSVMIPLQYTNRICESAGLSLQELWKDDAILDLARLELEWIPNISDPSERLKIWLDNYVERGSFDDRTLVVITM